MAFTYANGKTPLSMLIHLGGNHWLAPGINARWQYMVRLGQEKYGVTLRITPSYGDAWGGWNGYRTLDAQVTYRLHLGSMAAWPGSSPHGRHGAIDCDNWTALAPGNRALAWSRFVALAKLAGFITGRIPSELWHLECDEDPWAIPAFAAVTINPNTTNKPKEWDEMASKEDLAAVVAEALAGRTDAGITALEIRDADGLTHKALLSQEMFRHLIAADDPDRIRNIFTADDQWVKTTLDELPRLLRSRGCDLEIWEIVPASSGGNTMRVLNPLSGQFEEGAVWTASNVIRAQLAKL